MPLVKQSVMGIFLVMVLFNRPSQAVAQEPVPPLPATPEPSECDVTPRTVQELRELATEAVSGASSPVVATPRATAFVVPDGERADEATIRAVTATVRESWACLKAGNVLAAQALGTDEAVRQELAALADQLEQFGGLDSLLNDPAAAASPVAVPPGLRGALIGVRDVVVLSDGGVGAVVEVAPPDATGTTGTREDYYILRDVDGRILIDELIPGIRGERLFGEESDAPGTPTS